MAGTEAPEVVGPHAVVLGKALTFPPQNQPAAEQLTAARLGSEAASMC